MSAPPTLPTPHGSAPAPADARRSRGWLSSPILWIIVGVVVVGIGVGLAVALSSGTAEPHGGSTGVVLQNVLLP